MPRALLILAALTLLLTACGSGNVFELSEGDCFNDPEESAAEISDVEVVDCVQAHDNEVHAVITLDDGDYPGSGEIEQIGETDCVGEFEDFVGIDYAESELFSGFLFPTEGSWSDGDRQIVCILWGPEPLLGSMAGAER